jgi:glycosyltransferase involved in cell wall biosynthesis
MNENSKKPHILVFLPDRLDKPFGMGESFIKTFEHLRGDFECSVVGFPADTPPDFVERYAGTVNPFPEIHASNLVTLFGQSEYVKEAVKLCDEAGRKPDLIYAYDWTTYLAAVGTAEIFKVPLVVCVSLSPQKMAEDAMFLGLNLNNPAEFWIHKSLMEMERYGLAKADRVIQVSERYAKRFEQHIMEKTSIIPNGVNTEEWGDENDSGDFQLPGDNKAKVVYIGRFAVMKGIHLLMRAHIPPEIDLIFIGSEKGGDAGMFSAVVEKAKTIPNVYYLGPLYGKEKIVAMKKADAVIMPSIHEPFGIVGLEAMASRSVLITTAKDGISDYVNDENAIVIEATPEGVEQGFKKLLSMTEDGKRIMTEKALETCRGYRWKDSAAKLKEVFRSLLF